MLWTSHFSPMPKLKKVLSFNLTRCALPLPWGLDDTFRVREPGDQTCVTQNGTQFFRLMILQLNTKWMARWKCTEG